ncbi:GNAT family N-acetyltransferase [Vibrio palustris]|uniref:Putative ribosomal N-acetyltransferase YdaF n=1 Tax=Vibrio palustris TaxID=1918946 RepID=A0A1R4B4I9_9VIBR|nr:GNAT family protein [Vibrio palustris]SJL83825.1 Putative ribosomal N-acetyltransferase YdaF [Vibrio palustris]
MSKSLQSTIPMNHQPMQFGDVTLRAATPEERDSLYELVVRDTSWTAHNAPYLSSQCPTIEEFTQQHFTALCLGEDKRLITVNGQPVGTVSYYWESRESRWLDIGIVIYDPDYWAQGVGYNALILWISHLFEEFDLPRIGLSTWSGNIQMLRCAHKLGLKEEGRVRCVRYYQGQYYDNVFMGVLKEEWNEIISELELPINKNNM